MSRFSQTHPLIQASELCPGDFLISQKCRGVFFFTFVDSHNFSVVVTYVIVRNSRRPRFNFRPYFQTLPVDSNAFSHIPVPVVHFELCSLQMMSLCALLDLVSLCRFRTMGWKKKICNFADELKTSIRVSEMAATSGKPTVSYLTLKTLN